MTALTERLVDRRLGFGADEPYVRERDLRVPLSDGVVLLADLYRAPGPLRPRPTVLMRTPYGRDGLGSIIGSLLARRGFQVLVQSTRGTFGSGGQFRPFLHESSDGLDTLAWVRGQDWCDGRVSMVGPSYVGHTQWAVAPYADPGLCSMNADITASEFTSTFYPGGAPGLLNLATWVNQIGRQERIGAVTGFLATPVFSRRKRRAVTSQPLQAADVALTGAPVVFWRDFVEHAEQPREFWAPAEHDGFDAAAMPPVCMVTGWWDLFLDRQLVDFTALQRGGATARITIGPWSHGDRGSLSTIAHEMVHWLGVHLHGGEHDGRAPVRVYVQHADRWTDLPCWPPPEARPTEWYLDAGGGLGPDRPAGTTPPSRFVYDPADPTPTVGGPMLQPPSKQLDNRTVEARDDVRVWTGPPLESDLDLLGPVSAVVYVRTGTGIGDVFVRLCDVGPDGASMNITDAMHRLVPDREATAPDGTTVVRMTLSPTGYRVRAGHRLRVQVAGAAFPRFARNPGTGERTATAVDGERISYEILHDSEHPSHVVLPHHP
ncbi:hydrolase, CocE/NonD family [Pseudonocardia sp. Ae406_Ps2]|uniref:CocE/NonD family hydrolase n=1 Tax=unclassified Pseudonocardia TaxID=2619320 RepID=UPI00094B711B|nr:MULTISPECIES: CocE/NonD family hydrolase [unclassified Pseudonocardia]OLL97719.1 hydrolase, CocE/NonD family [Pseudonocardia sp. Ae331_Ps2]OLM04565.1 hydrolase, CocE/NonD family [Pseudonocardia sp. Ae406_Ps2]OLM10606.1 hydrolase, CocE/NonD family [Pseudonocardia sp. Ae505_Ps2]OLM26134.1 hydrolase, CocE/NonD family [Pseudonocardia sp. Ae706_Ps2]OLM33760.1 hydrolase, CocE/NonD family [Pseudonocardia sp. Ae717_Ps2]